MVALLHALLMVAFSVALTVIVCWLACQIISFVHLVFSRDHDDSEDLR